VVVNRVVNNNNNKIIKVALENTRKNTQQLPPETIVGPWIRGLRA